MTLHNFGLVDSESVGEWLFNFDPLLDLSLLVVNVISDAALAGQEAVFEFEADSFEAEFMGEPDGLFDIRILFPPPTGSFEERFTAGEFASYELIYPTEIDMYSFTARAGSHRSGSAAQIHSVGPGLDSVWVVSPEPSLGLLLGVGVVGLVVLRRGGRKSQ